MKNAEKLSSLLSEIRTALPKKNRLKFETAFELLNREALFDSLCGTAEIEDTERHPEFCTEADEAQEKAFEILKSIGLAARIEELREAIDAIWNEAYKNSLRQSRLFQVKHHTLPSEDGTEEA